MLCGLGLHRGDSGAEELRVLRQRGKGAPEQAKLWRPGPGALPGVSQPAGSGLGRQRWALWALRESSWQWAACALGKSWVGGACPPGPGLRSATWTRLCRGLRVLRSLLPAPPSCCPRSVGTGPGGRPALGVNCAPSPYFATSAVPDLLGPWFPRLKLGVQPLPALGLLWGPLWSPGKAPACPRGGDGGSCCCSRGHLPPGPCAILPTPASPPPVLASHWSVEPLFPPP